MLSRARAGLDDRASSGTWTPQDTLDEARATYEGMPERSVRVPESADRDEVGDERARIHDSPVDA
jgi:hypothetical protein